MRGGIRKRSGVAQGRLVVAVEINSQFSWRLLQKSLTLFKNGLALLQHLLNKE